MQFKIPCNPFHITIITLEHLISELDDAKRDLQFIVDAVFPRHQAFT